MASLTKVPISSPSFSSLSILVNQTTSTRTQTLIQSTASAASKFTKSLSVSEPSSAIGSTMFSTNISSTPPSSTTKNQGPNMPQPSAFGIVMISFAGFLIVFLIVALIWMRKNRESRADGPRVNVKMRPPGLGARTLKPPEASISDLDQSEVSELPSSCKVDHPLSRSNPNLSTSSFEQETTGNNNVTQTSEGNWRESKLI